MFQLVPDVRIAFIYFNHKDKPSAVEFLGTLLKQLLQQKGAQISPKLRDLHATHLKRKTRPSLNEISDLLVFESGAVSKLYMVVDALDECPMEANTKDNVLRVLQKLPNLHLLVTSRPHVDIGCDFNTVELGIQANKHDMEAFVRGRLEEEPNLKRYVRDDFKETLIEKVMQKSEGM